MTRSPTDSATATPHRRHSRGEVKKDNISGQDMDMYRAETVTRGDHEGGDGGEGSRGGGGGAEEMLEASKVALQGGPLLVDTPQTGPPRCLFPGLEVEAVAEVVAYDLLVVDDSSLNRKMLGKVFRLAGYQCDEAFDGVSAVEKVKKRMMEVEADQEGEPGDGTERVRKKNYDAILMDFVMPIMDGPTATSVIRSLGFTNPIFGVTGNTLDSDIEYFISKGANAVLPKPFDFERFKQIMRDARREAKKI